MSYVFFKSGFLWLRGLPHTHFTALVWVAVHTGASSGPDYSKPVLIIFLHRYMNFIVYMRRINFAIC